MFLKALESKGGNDIGANTLNITVNAAAVAIGGSVVGAITKITLNALGFSHIAPTVSAIPLFVGSLGYGVAIGGGLVLAGLLITGNHTRTKKIPCTEAPYKTWIPKNPYTDHYHNEMD